MLRAIFSATPTDYAPDAASCFHFDYFRLPILSLIITRRRLPPRFRFRPPYCFFHAVDDAAAACYVMLLIDAAASHATLR